MRIGKSAQGESCRIPCAKQGIQNIETGQQAPKVREKWNRYFIETISIIFIHNNVFEFKRRKNC